MSKDTRVYLAQSTDVLNTSDGTLLVRLMMAYQVLRAARAWVSSAGQRVKSNDTAAARSEMNVAFLTLAAWAAEAAKLIKCEMGRRLQKPHDKMHDAVWSELLKWKNEGDKSQRLKRSLVIRDKHAFHFDKKSAKRAIDLIRKTPADYPIFETTSDPKTSGTQKESSYSWGILAINTWASEKGDAQEAQENTECIGTFALELNNLLGCLIAQSIKTLGLRAEPSMEREDP